MALAIAPSPILEKEEGIEFLEQLAREEHIKEPVWHPSAKLADISKKILERSKRRTKQIFFREWTLKPICPSTPLKGYDCGNEDLNDFFKTDAVKNEKELLGKTYLLTRDGYEITDEDPPIALVCFCNGSIHITAIPDFEKKEGVNYYEYLPTTKIARLGVHRDFQGDHIGRLILTMTKSIFLTQNRTGCRILTVDAYKNEGVVTFYNKNEFKRIPEGPKEKKAHTWTMYYDLKRFQDPKGIFF